MIDIYRLLGPLGVVGIGAVALITACLPNNGFPEGSWFGLLVSSSGDPVVAYLMSAAIYFNYLLAAFEFAALMWEELR